MVVSKRKKERRRWRLGAKEVVEETEAYKYLGVWFDVQLSGRVHPG